MEKKCVVISRCPLLAALVFRVLQVEAKSVCWRIWRWWIHWCFCSAFNLFAIKFYYLAYFQSSVCISPNSCVEYTWCHFHLSRYHIWMPSSTHWSWLHNYWCVPFFSVVWSCREPLPPCQWYLSTGAQRFPDYTEGNVATVWKAKTFWLPLLPHHR